MGDHRRRVDLAGSHHVDGLLHVVGVAAGSAHEVGIEIVYVIEVEFRLELLIRRAGEEVQAAVEAEDGVRLLDHAAHRGEADHVVKARAAGKGAQVFHAVFRLGGVDVVQFDAQGLGVLHGIDALGAGQALVVDVGDDQQAGPAVAVQRVVDGAQAHRPHGGEQRHFAALDDAHIVRVAAELGVIHGVEGADDAAHRLGQGAVEIGVRIVGEQVVGQKRLDRHQRILGIAAAILIGIARGELRALVEVRRLDGEALTGLVLVLPVFAYRVDHAAELMADDGGMLRHVVGHALVIRALNGGFIGAHADRVGNDLYPNVVVPDLGELDLFQTQIHLAVDAYRFGHHSCVPP